MGAIITDRTDSVTEADATPEGAFVAGWFVEDSFREGSFVEGSFGQYRERYWI
jgi:hypothetical protein